MKISHVSGSTNKNFIEVRQYTNSIVNISQEVKPKNSDFCNGVWKVKTINIIPKEYASDYEFVKK